MNYFKDLSQLLAAILDPNKHTSALFLLSKEEDLIKKMLDNVVVKEGYGLAQYCPDIEEFIDFLAEFTIAEVALIEKKKSKWPKEDKIKYFIRLVAQHWWGKALHLTPKKQEYVLTAIMAKKQDFIKIIGHKLSSTTHRSIEVEEYFSHAIEKLTAGIMAGTYKGGNVKTFIKEAAYNRWRNNIKRPPKTDLTEEREKMGGFDSFTASENDMIDDQLDAKELLKNAFKKLSSKCQDVVLAILRQGKKTNKQLMDKLDYKSEAAYRNAKSKCMTQFGSFLTQK